MTLWHTTLMVTVWYSRCKQGPAVLAHPVHVVDTGAQTQHVQYGLWVGLHKEGVLPPASTNTLLCTQLGVTHSSSTQRPG